MSNEQQGIDRKPLGATLSGEPDRELELNLKKNPGDKQGQVDVGSDGSMDASDPPSACQPAANDPAPSNDFPEAGPQYAGQSSSNEPPNQLTNSQQSGPAKNDRDDTPNPLPDDPSQCGGRGGGDAGRA